MKTNDKRQTCAAGLLLTKVLHERSQHGPLVSSPPLFGFGSKETTDHLHAEVSTELLVARATIEMTCR